MAVEIISTAGQAHLVRAFYSAFYRDVIWIYLLQSCRRCCGYGKEKSAKRRVFLSLKDLKLRILKIELSGRHKLRMFVLNMSDTYFEMWWERREWGGGLSCFGTLVATSQQQFVLSTCTRPGLSPPSAFSSLADSHPHLRQQLVDPK